MFHCINHHCPKKEICYKYSSDVDEEKSSWASLNDEVCREYEKNDIKGESKC